MFDSGTLRENENGPRNVSCCPSQPRDGQVLVKPIPVSFQLHTDPRGRGLDFTARPSPEFSKMAACWCHSPNRGHEFTMSMSFTSDSSESQKGPLIRRTTCDPPAGAGEGGSNKGGGGQE